MLASSGLTFLPGFMKIWWHKPVTGSFYLIRFCSNLHLKCDGTRAETRFRLSAKRTSIFKSAGASVQSTTDSRGVRISGSNAGYTMFRGSVKSSGYQLHWPVSPSLPLPCVTVCHHVSTGLCLWSGLEQKCHTHTRARASAHTHTYITPTHAVSVTT